MRFKKVVNKIKITQTCNFHLRNPVLKYKMEWHYGINEGGNLCIKSRHPELLKQF